MQILSKFCHSKHLTRSAFAPVTPLWQFCPLTLFYHHNAQMRCYSTVLLLLKKQVVIHRKILLLNSKANKYQQNYKQTIFP